jgi:hypothetical protein
MEHRVQKYKETRDFPLFEGKVVVEFHIGVVTKFEPQLNCDLTMLDFVRTGACNYVGDPILHRSEPASKPLFDFIPTPDSQVWRNDGKSFFC